MLDTEGVAVVTDYAALQMLNGFHVPLNEHRTFAGKEVAAHFESVLVEMLMKSMQGAGEVLPADSNSDIQSKTVQDLFNTQLLMSVPYFDIDLAGPVEAPLINSPNEPQSILPSLPVSATGFTAQVMHQSLNQTAVAVSESKQSPSTFNTAGDFVKILWSSAKEAASLLGIDPKLLLAQAALETNWGKQILPMMTGESTHNLFNIKAESSWQLPSTQVEAFEFEEGVMVKNKSRFRAYESYADSFKDYVHFLQHNSRYQDALKCASRPQEFAQQLQKASYATDQHYSDKILQIYSSKTFNDIFIANGLTDDKLI